MSPEKTVGLIESCIYDHSQNHLLFFVTVCKLGLNQRADVQKAVPEATDTKHVVSLIFFGQYNVYYLLPHP